MKRMIIFFMALIILLLGVAGANAQQGLIETVGNGCKMEIEKYCSQVTPGQGRILACLYADLEKYCESIAPGKGRLLDCLKKHDKQVSKRCKQAVKDVGLK